MIWIDPALKLGLFEAIAARLDAGSGTAKLRIYGPNKPSPGGEITNQLLLAEAVLARPFAAAIDGTQLLPHAVTSVMVQTEGAAAWSRFLGGDGSWVMDTDVGDENSAAFIRIQGGTYLLAGGLVFFTVGPITM
jgi:hypothetical protein